MSSAGKKSPGQRSSIICPIALDAVQRLDALFNIERGINGKAPAERRAVRHELSTPLMAELNTWLADALSQIADCPVSKLDELQLWNWAAQTRAIAA